MSERQNFFHHTFLIQCTLAKRHADTLYPSVLGEALTGAMRGIVLSEINDRKLLERIVGWEVYGRDGKLVGVLHKVFVSKRTKQPLKVVIKKVKGGQIELSPDRLRVDRGKVILLEEEGDSLIKAVKHLEEILSDLKNLKNEIFKLDEEFINGRITWESFCEKRKSLDEKRILLKIEAYQLLEALTQHAENYDALSDEDRKHLAYILDLLSADLPVVSVDKVLRIFAERRDQVK